MYTLDIDTERPYRVLIGTLLLEHCGEIVREASGGSRALVVTDTNVGPLYAAPVSRSLEEAGYDTRVHVFEAGEEHKRAETYLAILEDAASHEMTRGDVVVALGGGVVGDVAGFAAATYMRGCHFVQIPTSLLAMVDSSVGGKTAIDLVCGKNLVGAFWQPDVVIADVGCLATLEPDQFIDGCGEVVKHAAIADEELFCELEQTPLTRELLLADLSRVAYLIARNIDIKRAVVGADERESGVRKLLNFGHSIGHAVETCSDFRLGHGACVAIGMVAMATACVRSGLCDPSVRDRIRALAAAHGLPTSCDFTADELYAAALHDKKRSGDAIDLVLPEHIGTCRIAHVPLPEFKKLIALGIEAEGSVEA